MQWKRRALAGALLGAALLAPGCSDVTEALPIITLTNTWREEGNEEHTFSILDDSDGVASNAGTFTGTETLPDGITEYEFDGNWSDGRVRMTVHRAQDITYTADINRHNTDRLVFSSSAGGLVLIRN
ncbi:MAG TPA: hypothetical protein VK939_18180 [Longimicrobiales bacterium]|nr:hypothetical protein [Longimicrobiales bacterium]